MEMKWNPIVNGDLSEVPLFEETLFTIIDTLTGDSYVICDEIDFTYARNDIAVFRNGALGSREKLIAWMEVPEPYEPTIDKCFKCNHGKLQQDEFSDNWFECELLQRDVPPNGKPEDCPLENRR